MLDKCPECNSPMKIIGVVNVCEDDDIIDCSFMEVLDASPAKHTAKPKTKLRTIKGVKNYNGV